MFLREADFSDLDFELLLLGADVFDGDVDDRQPRRLRVLHAEHRQRPLLVLMLKGLAGTLVMANLFYRH